MITRFLKNWSEDQATMMGAALAYYALFSLAPLLIVALTVASTIYGEKEAQEQVIQKAEEFLGPDSAATVRQMLENFRKPSGSGVWYVVGGLTLLYGSTGMFIQLRSALRRIWRLPPPTSVTILQSVFDYLIAIVLVLVTSIFFLLLLVSTTVLAVLHERWHDVLPGGLVSWWVVDFAASTFLLFLQVLFLYRFMSDGKIRYGRLLPGALLASLLFNAGKLGLAHFIGQMQAVTAYGAASSLVIFLVWIYYSAQILFVGAEFIRLGLDRSRPRPAVPAG